MKLYLFTVSGAVTTGLSSGKFTHHLMLRLLFTLTFLCTFAHRIWADADYLACEQLGSTTEGLDSASYAYGDMIIRSIVESPDSVFPTFEYNKENLSELIRGLQEQLVYMKYSQDSIKNISLSLGAMQGVLMWDRFQFKMDLIPFDCILAGLMKDINHELTLPQDTVKIQEYMKSLPENMKPEELPDEEKCLFFTDYGIMKGLQPGLQGYILEMTGKSEDEAPADYEAYAVGMAMMVKLMSLDAKQASEQTPYDNGVSIGISLIAQPLPFTFTESDFLDGCRAAAGLNERRITVEESDRIISTVFPNSEAPIMIQQELPD